MSPSKPSWLVPLKLAVLRGLEALSRLRQQPRKSLGKSQFNLPCPDHASAATSASASAVGKARPRSLWLFVSTIGELNATEPFLNRLLDELGQPALTLISDRPIYADAFSRRYPQANQVITDGSMVEVDALVRTHPPLMLLVAEIPALLHDAPCRFSFATVHAARQAGAPVVLVNGWLYGYAPPSRLDRIEHALFARDHVQTFDLMLVQTDAMREALIRAGARPERVVVTGNIKFDALSPDHVPATPLSTALLRRANGPLIVAGSVTETADQRGLIDSFRQVCQAWPGAMLVLAPRHPENLPRMSALKAMLTDSGLTWRLRSACTDPATACDTAVLVLDTMGELRACYAAATLAYVGTDHNVLEPLAFGKPVSVSGRWEPGYPSYPVYQQLLQAGVLHAVPDTAELATGWLQQMGQQPAEHAHETARIRALIAMQSGASERNLQALRHGGLVQRAASVCS